MITQSDIVHVRVPLVNTCVLVRTRSLGGDQGWRHGHETQSRGGSLDGITWHRRPQSNCKSARPRVKISTKAPPPKSLEVEPGNEASQDDV